MCYATSCPHVEEYEEKFILLNVLVQYSTALYIRIPKQELRLSTSQIYLI